MKPEKQQLIHDLLDDGGQRQSTLLAASNILRRHRHWRAARHTLVLLMIMGAILWLALPNKHRQITAKVLVTPPEAKVPASLHLKSLTDQQLLDLFPDTPVGLATLPNGKKLLLFPHPGDDAKFVTRL